MALLHDLLAYDLPAPCLCFGRWRQLPERKTGIGTGKSFALQTLYRVGIGNIESLNQIPGSGSLQPIAGSYHGQRPPLWSEHVADMATLHCFPSNNHTAVCGGLCAVPKERDQDVMLMSPQEGLSSCSFAGIRYTTNIAICRFFKSNCYY